MACARSTTPRRRPAKPSTKSKGSVSVEEPKTFDDLLGYIERYCADILVRDFHKGKIGNYYLAELPASQALRHAFKWIRSAYVPGRHIRPESQPDDSEVPNEQIRTDTNPTE